MNVVARLEQGIGLLFWPVVVNDRETALSGFGNPPDLPAFDLYDDQADVRADDDEIRQDRASLSW